MDDRSTQILVLTLAVATPALAAVMAMSVRSGATGPLRPGRLLLLALAGPLNALAWFALQGPLEGATNRTAFGIGLAALVFLGIGFGAGWLRRPRDHEAGSAGDTRGHGNS